jgi:4-hydroxybenzoyl-CoA thioesterase
MSRAMVPPLHEPVERHESRYNPAVSDSSFVYPARVRWGDCDPAGIIYFPRYFDFFHQAMEAWFEEALSMPYSSVIIGRKIGFPSVHTEADFRAPSAFGDRVDVRLTVPRLGRTSVEFAYRVQVAGAPDELRATGRTVCVVMDLDPQSAQFRQAIPIPDDIRAAIEGFRSVA